MNLRKIIFYIFIISLMLLFGCTNKDNGKEMDKGNTPELTENELERNIVPEEPEEKVDIIMEQIKEMSLEEKIGQMFIVGLEGQAVDENTIKMITEYYVGGFILFSKNIKDSDQLLSLVNSLKELNAKNKTPLFISVDEEGGRVSRMPSEIKKLPSNKKIGELNNRETTYEIGRILGEELKSFGFNVNYAPVLDINNNPDNPVIGDRAFGDNKIVVSSLGVEIMKGIQSKGVISVIKHFPGHGDTSVDSHKNLPSIEIDLERLKSFELLPFKTAIENGADAVMIAHILLPKIDGDYPSSLSKTVITDILRGDLGFDGVVISDDMTMGAIVENYEIGEAAVNAINAGTDIVLVAHGFENGVFAISAVKEAVENNIITEDRLDESVYRVLKLKEKYSLDNSKRDSIDVEYLNSKIEEVLEKFREHGY